MHPTRSQTPWCAIYREVRVGNLLIEFLSKSLVFCQISERMSNLLKKMTNLLIFGEQPEQIAHRHSTVCITPRSHTPQCASHCEVKLHSVIHTAESSDKSFLTNFAVCITLRSQAPQCASYHRVKLHGVHHTAESK